MSRFSCGVFGGGGGGGWGCVGGCGHKCPKRLGLRDYHAKPEAEVHKTWNVPFEHVVFWHNYAMIKAKVY